jgi:hypothetical protein
MVMMVLLTLIVGMIAFVVRLSSYRSGEIKVKYFKLMQGQEVPAMVTKTTRSFNNMFETPVIFYTACTLYLVMNVESMVGIVLAWVFIGLRYLHATIHLTYNHILHRMLAFWAAFLCAVALWFNLVIQVS